MEKSLLSSLRRKRVVSEEISSTVSTVGAVIDDVISVQ